MKRSEYIWLQARTQHSRIRYVSACFKSVNIKQKKPAWEAVRRKNGMKLLIKKASDGDLLALLGCTVSSQGMQHKWQCKRTRLGQTTSEQRCSAESCAPTRTELGTSISGFWHQLLLFYRVIQNLLMDFHLKYLNVKAGSGLPIEMKGKPHTHGSPELTQTKGFTSILTRSPKAPAHCSWQSMLQRQAKGKTTLATFRVR